MQISNETNADMAGEGLDGAGEPGAAGESVRAALPPGMRQMLNIPAQLPQPMSNQVTTHAFVFFLPLLCRVVLGGYLCGPAAAV